MQGDLNPKKVVAFTSFILVSFFHVSEPLKNDLIDVTAKTQYSKLMILLSEILIKVQIFYHYLNRELLEEQWPSNQHILRLR